MKGFHDFPEDLYLILRSYLSSLDYFYFVSCNKQLFSQIRKQTVQFFLDREWSNEFFQNENFRSCILERVEIPKKQIFVHYSNRSEVFPNLQIFDLISGIEFHELTEDSFPLLQKILPKFERIFHLSINNFATFPDLPNLRELSLELSPELCFLQHLRNLQKLEIFHCESVRNLQELAMIPDLSITSCPNITDFSCLGRQKSLTISDCLGLKDVRSFGTVTHLTLSECLQLVDIHPLKGIYDLTLLNMPQIQDLSGLGGHYRFTVMNCHRSLLGYEDIFPLIPHLGISLPSREMLDDNHCSLSFYGIESTAVNDFRFLLPKTVSLSIYECYQLPEIFSSAQIHYFQHLSFLGLYGCSLTTANGLGGIYHLCIEYCEELVDISELGQNHTVRLLSCDNVQDVRSLSTVPNVTIINCVGVRNEESLSGVVPRLRIVKPSSRDSFYQAM